MSGTGEHIRQITDPAEGQIDLYPVWSPDGEWIAFSREGESGGIYSVRPDGSELTRLVRGNVTRPNWSPDGSRLLFMTYDKPQQPELVELWTANSDGTDAYPLVDSDMFVFAADGNWSPDGSQVTFTGKTSPGDNFQVYVINADGSNLRKLTVSGDNMHPAWFPQAAPWDPMQIDHETHGENASGTDESESLHPTPTPFVAIPASLAVPSLPSGWRLFYDPNAQIAMGIGSSWESKSNDAGIPFFVKADYPGLHVSLLHLPGLAFEPSTEYPTVEFAFGHLPKQVHGLGHIGITQGAADEVWEDGSYRTVYTAFFTTNDMDDVMFKGIAIAIPRGDGTFPVLMCLTDGRDLTEEDLEIIRTVSSSIRFGDDAVAAARAYAPKPTPTPDCFEYIGEVEGYAEYPGMGILVKVLDRDGNPVPGVKVHTHAFNTEFWDATGEDGAFRRDGFTQAIVWEVSLPDEPAEKLGVRFEYNKLALVTFRLGNCR